MKTATAQEQNSDVSKAIQNNIHVVTDSSEKEPCRDYNH